MERILIVEDEASIRRALVIGLASKDFEVDAVGDGSEGILQASRKGYHVLISDLCLPDMDGLELIRNIKGNNPEIIPIVITGKGSMESSLKAIRLGVSDYLEKPFCMESVKNSIARGIEKRTSKRKTIQRKVQQMLENYKNTQLGIPGVASNAPSSYFKQIFNTIPQLVHQINNPLTAISGTAQRAMFDLDDERLIKYFTRIIKATEKISSVNQEIMKLGRLEDEEIEMVDMKSLLEDCLELFEEFLSLKGVLVETDIEGFNLILYGNRFKLEQIFKNLIVNAIESMKDAPEKLLKVSAAGNKDASMISVCINDTGCGIPEESMDKIFSKYFTNKSHGTGLGLTVVKSFVEKHKGKIRIESVVGKGTTVTVGLPINN